MDPTETTGFAARVLAHPRVYWTYHRVIGSPGLWRAIVDYLDLRPGHRVLDLGCGPGTMAGLLPAVDYVGVEYSAEYVDLARRRWSGRGTVIEGDATALDPDTLGRFDRVLAHGLLHHLDDADAAAVIDLAGRVLEPSGQLVTVDGCRRHGEGRIARFLLDHDRGEYVRDRAGYERLLDDRFAEVDLELRTDLLRVPYSLMVGRARDPRR